MRTPPPLNTHNFSHANASTGYWRIGISGRKEARGTGGGGVGVFEEAMTFIRVQVRSDTVTSSGNIDTVTSSGTIDTVNPRDTSDTMTSQASVPASTSAIREMGGADGGRGERGEPMPSLAWVPACWKRALQVLCSFFSVFHIDI